MNGERANNVWVWVVSETGGLVGHDIKGDELPAEPTFSVLGVTDTLIGAKRMAHAHIKGAAEIYFEVCDREVDDLPRASNTLCGAFFALMQMTDSSCTTLRFLPQQAVQIQRLAVSAD